MIKEYSELVVDFFIADKRPDFKLEAGIYKNEEYEAFIFEITDLRPNGVTYTNSFNSLWCPKENRQWFAEVIIRQMTDNIREASNNQKKASREAYKNFMRSIGEK